MAQALKDTSYCRPAGEILRVEAAPLGVDAARLLYSSGGGGDRSWTEIGTIRGVAMAHTLARAWLALTDA